MPKAAIAVSSQWCVHAASKPECLSDHGVYSVCLAIRREATLNKHR
jgi:hypothetical protein